MNELFNELAISSRYLSEMDELANTVPDSPHRIEKYPHVIAHLCKRLVKMARDSEEELASLNRKHLYMGDEVELVAGWESIQAIENVKELMDPLKIMYDSLIETGFELVADGLLANITRRMATFGMTFEEARLSWLAT